MDEMKLTDEEIVKAMEICRNGTQLCENCPCFIKDVTCICSSEEDIDTVLDLINRQKAEIERLTEENTALSKGVKRLKKRYEETIKQNADECVKKFCETTMYAEQERLLKQNSELQKQVDELTSEKEDLYFQNKNLQTYIDNHEPIWKRNTEQAVKDTAKEILITTIQLSDMCESFYEFQNRLIDFIEVNYSVEIVQETIIPAKGVEVE